MNKKTKKMVFNLSVIFVLLLAFGVGLFAFCPFG